MQDGFPTCYSEFRTLVTQRCGTALTLAYCRERIAALSDDSIPTTREFVRHYGPQHQRQVITWYEQALHEVVN